MRKKIVGMVAIIAVLAMLCTQAAAAPNIIVTAWTDKPQYDLGEKGKLKISILNLEEDDAIQIYNVTIEYPWFRYDANEDKWVGNDTITGDNRILETITSKDTDDDHYYLEVEFTVPSDGRAASGEIDIEIYMSDPDDTEYMRPLSVSIYVAATSWPMSLANLDTWMTSLIVTVVVCTIILAIVILLGTRKTRASRAFVPRAPPPPPPKPKAKA